MQFVRSFIQHVIVSRDDSRYFRVFFFVCSDARHSAPSAPGLNGVSLPPWRRGAHTRKASQTPQPPRPRTHTHTGIKREYNTLQSTRGSGNVRAQRQMLKFNLILSVIYFSSPVVRRWPRWRSVCVCVCWQSEMVSAMTTQANRPGNALACKRACFCVPLGWRRCVASAILCVFNTHVHVRVYCKCCFFSLPFCLHSFTAVMYRTATNTHASTILLLCVSTLKTIPLNNARNFF